MSSSPRSAWSSQGVLQRAMATPPSATPAAVAPWRRSSCRIPLPKETYRDFTDPSISAATAIPELRVARPMPTVVDATEQHGLPGSLALHVLPGPRASQRSC